jgi:hypothetical protein
VRAGAEPGHVRTRLGGGVLGGAAPQAGNRLGPGQILLPRGSRRSITPVSPSISALTRSMRAGRAAVPGVQPDQAELLGGHESRR